MWIDWADTLPGTLFALLMRATILLAIAGIVVWFLCRASAAYRHLVWTLALASVFVSLLIQPLISRVPAPWSVTVPLPLTAQTTLPQSQALPLVSAAPLEPPPAADTPTAVTAPFRVPWWTNLVLCVWLGGTGLVLSRLLLGLRLVRILYRQSTAPEGERGEMIASALSGVSVVRSSVRIAPSASPVSAPMTWGWYRPVVLLPASAEAWSTEAVRAALLHEVGHIRRADWLIQMGITLTCALYWWHPLVWWAARRAREESERACDDFVLNAGVPPADYAAHLVAVIRALRGGANHHGAAMAMAVSNGMERRVRAVLSSDIPHHSVTRHHLAIGVGVSVLLLSGFVCLHPVLGARRNTISFYYFSTVACQADRSRPLEVQYLSSSRSTGGNSHSFSFLDKRTGKTFRDGVQLLAAFAQLANQGKTPRTGASALTVPDAFRGAAPQATLYLDAHQRSEAEHLHAELKAWRGLLAASPRVLSSADLKPKAVVIQRKDAFMVQLTLTPSGAKKLSDFTGRHRQEILGVVLDPDQPGSQLNMAPTINEAFTSPTLELSGFKTHADAERLAARLNAR